MGIPDPPLRRSAYQPALDGIRGVSVAMVLLFHGGFTWMTGGYVGVSVFFTLSGFLITGLLLSEHRQTGRISMHGFYARRVRRLMPASLFCLTAVAVAAAFGEFDGLSHVRGDMLASLFQVANWNALHNGTSYADLIARTTGQLGPVDHFWSLSVEEQFYWIWPVVAVLVLARAKRVRTVRISVVGLAALAVGIAPVIAHVWGPNAAYWATPARLGEILVGAGLAAVMSGRRWPTDGVWRRVLAVAGLGGLAVIVVAAITWPSGSGPAYHGWLGVFALASAALIAGVQVASPLRRVLSLRPLVHLGRISYGVYLYHWPIFAMVTGHRVGVGGWVLFAIRIAITLVVAEASFFLLEQPVRKGVAPPVRVAWTMVGALAAVASLVALAVPAPVPAFSITSKVPATFAPAPSTVATPAPDTIADTVETAPSEPAATDSTAVVAPVVPTTTPDGPVTVLILGDSTAMQMSVGMAHWAAEVPAEAQVASLARVGCGLVRLGAMKGDAGNRYLNDCAHVLNVDLPRLLRQQRPDVVMIMVTIPDMLARVWHASEGPLHPRDPRYAERLVADYRAEADRLVAAGVRHIVWTLPPRPSSRWVQNSFDPVTDADWAVLVHAIEEEPGRYPNVVSVLHLDDWMSVHEPTDGSMRPDGLHLSDVAAGQVADAFVGPAVLAIGRT